MPQMTVDEAANTLESIKADYKAEGLDQQRIDSADSRHMSPRNIPDSSTGGIGNGPAVDSSPDRVERLHKFA